MASILPKLKTCFCWLLFAIMMLLAFLLEAIRTQYIQMGVNQRLFYYPNSVFTLILTRGFLDIITLENKIKEEDGSVVLNLKIDGGTRLHDDPTFDSLATRDKDMLWDYVTLVQWNSGNRWEKIESHSNHLVVQLRRNPFINLAIGLYINLKRQIPRFSATPSLTSHPNPPFKSYDHLRSLNQSETLFMVNIVRNVELHDVTDEEMKEYFSFMFGEMRKNPNYVGPVALLSADDDTELDIDGVTIVCYQSRQFFLDVISSEEYIDRIHLKTKKGVHFITSHAKAA